MDSTSNTVEKEAESLHSNKHAVYEDGEISDPDESMLPDEHDQRRDGDAERIHNSRVGVTRFDEPPRRQRRRSTEWQELPPLSPIRLADRVRQFIASTSLNKVMDMDRAQLGSWFREAYYLERQMIRNEEPRLRMLNYMRDMREREEVLTAELKEDVRMAELAASSAPPVWFRGATPQVGYRGTAPPVAYSGTAAPVAFNGTAAPVAFNGPAAPVTYSGTAAPVTFNGTAPPAAFSGTAPPATYSGTASPVAYSGITSPVAYGGAAQGGTTQFVGHTSTLQPNSSSSNRNVPPSELNGEATAAFMPGAVSVNVPPPPPVTRANPMTTSTVVSLPQRSDEMVSSIPKATFEGNPRSNFVVPPPKFSMPPPRFPGFPRPPPAASPPPAPSSAPYASNCNPVGPIVKSNPVMNPRFDAPPDFPMRSFTPPGPRFPIPTNGNTRCAGPRFTEHLEFPQGGFQGGNVHQFEGNDVAVSLDDHSRRRFRSMPEPEQEVFSPPPSHVENGERFAGPSHRFEDRHPRFAPRRPFGIRPMGHLRSQRSQSGENFDQLASARERWPSPGYAPRNSGPGWAPRIFRGRLPPRGFRGRTQGFHISHHASFARRPTCVSPSTIVVDEMDAGCSMEIDGDSIRK